MIEGLEEVNVFANAKLSIHVHQKLVTLVKRGSERHVTPPLYRWAFWFWPCRLHW